MNDNYLKARIFGTGMVNPESRFREVIIEDIPVMITETNKILCIPNTEEIKHVGVTGMTGTNKSLFINALLSWEYWNTNRLCLVLNDFQQETFEWSMPTDNNSFKYILKKINAFPCPTPLVYVFPSTKTLQIDEDLKKFPYMKMTLPIGEVIRNVENYYSLDRSKVYLGNLMDDLIECNSMEEIREVLNENIPEKHRMMKYKLMNIFEALFENNMLNVAVPDAPAYLEIRNKRGNYYNLTLQTLMAAGLVPSVQTSDLRNQDYFAAYISFIVNNLYRNQYEDEFFSKKTISLFVDEIDKIWQGNNGTIGKTALNLIGTNGRTARIGLKWSTQHYGTVPDQIRNNTKFLFVTRKSHAKEVNEIRKDFDIPKIMDKDILNLKTDPLNGVFEMVALTTEKFVLYDLISGKKTLSSDAQKGILIPPRTRHHVPNQPLIK